MAHYQKIKYTTLLFSLCMSLDVFASEATVSSPQYPLEEQRKSMRSKRTHAEISDKRKLLLTHLPLQIEALKPVQEKYRSIIDDQKRRGNTLEAFRAACSLANLQGFRASIQDIINCLEREDNPHIISIGIGAAPALKEGIDQMGAYLDEAGIPCDSFKKLAEEFQKITRDIPNPEFPADSLL